MGRVNVRDEVRDTVSGFEGTVASRTEWAFGCIRCGVTGKELHDGKPTWCEFDEPQLEVTKAFEEPVPMIGDEGGPHGGRPAATRPSAASRHGR